MFIEIVTSGSKRQEELPVERRCIVHDKANFQYKDKTAKNHVIFVTIV